MKGQQAKIIIIHEYNHLNLSKFLNPTLKTSIQPFPKIYKRSGHQRYLFNIQQIISGKGQSFQRDCCEVVYQERHRIKTEIDGQKTRRIGLNSISLPKRESCNKTSCIASRSLSKSGTPKHSRQNKRNQRFLNNIFDASKSLEQDKMLNERQQLRESQTSHKIFQNDPLLKNSSESRIRNLIPIVNQFPEPTSINNKNNLKDEGCQTQFSHLSLKSSQVKQNLQIKPKEQIYQTPIAKKRLNTQTLSDSKISKEELQQNLGKMEQKKINKTVQKKIIRKQSSEEDNRSNSLLQMSSGKVSSTIFHKIKQSVTKSGKKLRKGSSQKAYSVMSNGLFKIPEQDEFEDYLKGYKPLNPTFDVRQLVQSRNFHIIPTGNNVYFGEVIDRKKNGKGITVSQKQIFEGAYRDNSKISGSQKNTDGVYTGEFLKGKRHGKGKFIWNNGQTFQGEWRSGKKNGFGLWRSPRGDYYQGEWKDNRQNGKGFYVYFGGSKYKGQFKDFLKHGQGDEAFANGDRYTGQYQFGKPHGQGRYIWANGDYYDGQFINGSREGRGKLIRISGQIYEGQFKDDEKNGLGTQKNTKSDQIFKGQFRKGQRYQGKLKQKNAFEVLVNPK